MQEVREQLGADIEGEPLTATRVRSRAAGSRRTEEGATATEYALLVTFVVFAIVAGLTVFGQRLDQLYVRLADWVATL